MTTESENPRPAWFVGAAFGGYDNQTVRFIQDGIWEGGPIETYGGLINSIWPGDRIVIKSTYTRKNELPFDNRGEFVSVMAIKATGIVVENLEDGHSLRVNWSQIDPPREWYFHTLRGTIAPVLPDSWWKNALLRFTFDGEDQDIGRSLRDPYWSDRYGYLEPQQKETQEEETSEEPPDERPRYDISNIRSEGCFLDQATLERMLQGLRAKKNVILQGPPGTGKTWLAKKLAYALIGRKDEDKIRHVQFHPNLSYEDFVRGWRPQGSDGKLELVDGPFLQLANEACQEKNRDDTYVMVIEEINRGNPASIFGELLTLLEADKRTFDNALTLSYRRDTDEPFHIPPNLYIIGTMNLADRSLALVDFALRRRFAFFDLEPEIDTWREWVQEQCEIPTDFLADISRRIDALNTQISDDPNLGRQFRIGHSFIVPKPGEPITVSREWFIQVVETEIAPLLREYWFNDSDKADEARAQLLSGL